MPNDNRDDLLDAIVDAIRDACSWCGDQYGVDERQAARAILAIPEIAAGLAALKMLSRITADGHLSICHGFGSDWHAWGEGIRFDGHTSEPEHGPTPAAAILALADAIAQEASDA